MGSSIANEETSLYDLLPGTLPFVRAGTTPVDIEFVFSTYSHCISEKKSLHSHLMLLSGAM
jgi:hypothetical protein